MLDPDTEAESCVIARPCTSELHARLACTVTFVPYPIYPTIMVDDTAPLLYRKTIRCPRSDRGASVGHGTDGRHRAHRPPVGNQAHRRRRRQQLRSGRRQRLPADRSREEAKRRYRGSANELTMALGRSHMTAQSLGFGAGRRHRAGDLHRVPERRPADADRAGRRLGDQDRAPAGLATLRPTDNALHTGIRRILRAWLTPGRGSNADIRDQRRAAVAVLVGRAEETPLPDHLSRPRNGARLAIRDGPVHGLPTTNTATSYIEEVICTGLPPYNFESVLRESLPRPMARRDGTAHRVLKPHFISVGGRREL